MFKKAAKPSLESIFTHQERSSEAPSPLLSPEEPLQNIQKSVSPETVVGATVAIQGTISFERFLRLDGHFTGQMHGPGGRLHIGPSGHVKADLCLESALIEGCLEGDIIVTGHLDVRATARIRGDISAKTLSVEAGATLQGKAEVSDS